MVGEEHEKLGYSPTRNMQCKLHVLGCLFLGDVFENSRLGFFADLTSLVVWLYGCVDVVVCYEIMPMMWRTEI